MVAQLAPAIRTFFSAGNRGLVEIRALRILNAMEEFKQLNGHEAQSLTELKLPSPVTTDPFSGRPMILKSTPDWLGDLFRCGKRRRRWRRFQRPQGLGHGASGIHASRKTEKGTEHEDQGNSPSPSGNAVEAGGQLSRCGGATSSTIASTSAFSSGATNDSAGRRATV